MSSNLDPTGLIQQTPSPPCRRQPPALHPRSKINKQAMPLFADLCLAEVLSFDLELLLPHHFLYLITIEFALYNAASLRWIPTSNLLWYCGLRFGSMHYRNSFNHSLELLSSVARSRPPRTGFLSICFLASIQGRLNR